jgi:hypothetical protein
VKLGILFFPEIITGIFCAALICDMCCDDFLFSDSSSKYACVQHGLQNLNPSLWNTFESVVLHCGARRLLAVHYSL